MKTGMYVIFDQKAQIFNTPFHQPNEAVLIRTATDLRNDPNSEISKHPEDYLLYHVADYENDTGVVTAVDKTLMINFAEIPAQ